MGRVGEEPTPSCDVWSIGVILFELITGKVNLNMCVIMGKNGVDPHTLTVRDNTVGPVLVVLFYDEA